MQSVSNKKYIDVPNTENNGVANILTKAFWAVMAPLDPAIGFFVTQPLADALALKTYTHGTNFTNYLNIRANGVDPSKGGNNTGSTSAFMLLAGNSKEDQETLEACKGHFYLFKDISDFSLEKKLSYKIGNKKVQFIHGLQVLDDSDESLQRYEGLNAERIYKGINAKLIHNGVTQVIPKYDLVCYKDGKEYILFQDDPHQVHTSIMGSYQDSFDKYYVRTVLPMRHAVFSGIGGAADLKEQGTLASIKRVLGGIGGALTPIISIRAAEGDPILDQLEEDPDFDLAYRTSESISTDYIGLAGIINQGLNSNLWQRVQKEPVKAAIGAARLTLLACALVYAS